MLSRSNAVLWELWTRQRWMLIGGSVWLIAVWGLCHAVADGVFLGVTFPMHEHGLLLIRLLGAAPLLYGLLPLFAYGCDGDIGGVESAFPSYTFTQPLTTAVLVSRPMFLGTSAGALTWLAAAGILFRPHGLEVALWWPAALVASCLTWIQALSWRPFGLPGLRIFTAAAAIAVLVAFSSLRWMADFHEGFVASLLLATIVPAYAVAVRGVARARRGDQPDLKWMIAWIGTLADRFALRGTRLSSPSRAQTWYEWRRFGLGLPLMVALMSLFLAILIPFSRHNPRLGPGSPLRTPFLLLAVPLFAGIAGSGNWGNCGKRGTAQAIPPFLATRPMRCSEFVWAKMKAAALSVGAGWGIVLCVIAAMFLLTNSWGDSVRWWNTITEGLSSAQQVAVVVLAAILLPAITWKSIISGLFIGLTGRNWVMVGGVCGMNIILFGAFLGGCRLSEYPHSREILRLAAPLVLALLAAVKLLLGVWLVRRNVRFGLIEPRLMRWLAVSWTAIAAALFGVFCRLIPSGLVPPYLILTGVILVLPLVRIALAPLALEWNRCR